MIVDLNLKGKRVAVIGAGREAGRKIYSLLTQKCKISVFADRINQDIRRWAEEGKLELVEKHIVSTSSLDNLDRLVLVIASTDDRTLNRRLANWAKKKGIYAYCADDPDNSDFSHPAVVNLKDVVKVTVSTGGRSPLMARRLREKLEPVLKEVVSLEDILQIRLQERLRPEVLKKITNFDLRKKFLVHIADDPEIIRLLSNNQFEKAEKMAIELLRSFLSAC